MNNFIKMPKKKGLFWILIFKGDYPIEAKELNLNKKEDRKYLEDKIEFIKRNTQGWGIAQFRDYKCYQKGRRLVGQHWQLRRDRNEDALNYYPGGIQIGVFQKLVQLLGYERGPLTEYEKDAIRRDYKYRGCRVLKLADDWDVSESYVRTILKGDKPPVLTRNDSINTGVSEVQPPGGGRVVLRCHGGSR